MADAGSYSAVTVAEGSSNPSYVEISWLSDASGDVSIATASATTAGVKSIIGDILGIVTTPGATTPSANYDVYIDDDDDANMIGTDGENRSNSAAERVTFSVPIPIRGTPRIRIDNAGNKKTGTVKLYYRRGGPSA